MINDDRVYSSFARLTLLAKRGRTLSWRPPYSKISPMSGQQKSHQRGRGLDFVELRHYFAGDDVRCIDWRVTQRTGQAFIRLYAEEKDKNTQLIIDLRSSMFFVSDGAMKSALASELAAVIAGRTQFEGDRIGALILTDLGIELHTPQRGEKSLLTLVEKIALLGRKLPQQPTENAPTLDDVLTQLCLQKMKESQIFIISDFVDYSPKSDAVIAQLAKHNNLVALRVSDPLEDNLPDAALVMGNGQLQLEIGHQSSRLRQRYNQTTQQQNQRLKDTLLAMGIPCLHLCTHQDCWQQLLEISMKGNG